MSIRVSLLGMLRLILVYILRRFHNVGFLTGRLIYISSILIHSPICHTKIIKNKNRKISLKIARPKPNSVDKLKGNLYKFGKTRVKRS